MVGGLLFFSADICCACCLRCMHTGPWTFTGMAVGLQHCAHIMAHPCRIGDTVFCRCAPELLLGGRASQKADICEGGG